MLRYRALLIDTTKSYARPVQQFFSNKQIAIDWAKAALAGAGKGSEVVFYEDHEVEMMTITKAELEGPSDESALQDLRQAGKQAG